MVFSRTKEGLASGEGVFGLAQVKAEGTAVPYDKAASAIEASDETYWFEQPFTKAEYAELAAALMGDSDLIVQLRKQFEIRAINGWG